jgi:YbbR domain-containing protein
MVTLDAEYVRKRLSRFAGVGERLRQSVGLSTILRFLLALALSLGLWVYVTMRNNPDISQTLSGRPVEVRGLANGSTLVTQLPLVDVTVSGPTTLVQTPTKPVAAYVDLANAPAMRGQRLPVKVELPRGVELVAVNPSEVVVDVEPIIAREYPVQVAVPVGLPADQRLEQPTIEPKSVTISGPRSIIGDIARVVVRPELGGNPDDLARGARPIPLDIAGREVTSPRMEINPASVVVTLPARTLRSSKTVPVRYSIVGQPAAGYQIGSIQTTPAQVNIVGDADLLQRVTALETEPIDITDRRQSLNQTVPLRVPTGVTAEQPNVLVDVGIAPIEARVRLTLNVIPTGYAPGLRVQVVPGTVDVTLKGPVPRIQEIDVGALRAEVRLQGYGPGTHVLPAQVIGPGLDRLEVVELQPARVTVQLSADQTATPSITPTTTAPVPTPASPTSTPPR